jgi:hypothetical protein
VPIDGRLAHTRAGGDGFDGERTIAGIAEFIERSAENQLLRPLNSRVDYRFTLLCAHRSQAWSEAGLGNERLEQFDGIPRWIFEDNLLSADAGDDFVSKAGTRVAQRVDHRSDIANLYGKAVPPAWLRLGAVRH